MSNENKFSASELESIVKSFSIEGTLLGVNTHKSGHINDTFLSEWKAGKGTRKFVHQRVNHNVFKDVPGLMKNIELITEHISKKLDPESKEKTLEIVRTNDGASFVVDRSGNFWRTYRFISDTVSVDVCESPEQAREASCMFGKFLHYLEDLSPDLITETIPNFQNTPLRYDAFRNAIADDRSGRASSIAREIDFALSMEAMGSSLTNAVTRGEVPRRVTHNDLKLNNVLFERTSGKGVCVVDLDTCMPGTALFDYGDLLRNSSVPVNEDEMDLSKVRVDETLYRAVVGGFLTGSHGYFTEAEIALLPVAPRVLALTLGVRFLTDYLNGDTYFKISKPSHNLDRTRAQFQLVRNMGEQEDFMRKVVEDSLKRK